MDSAKRSASGLDPTAIPFRPAGSRPDAERHDVDGSASHAPATVDSITSQYTLSTSETARPDPANTEADGKKKKWADFTDLPGELQNRVYRLLLVFSPAFEFVPQTDSRDPWGERRSHEYTIARRKKIFVDLQLLRANKEVNKAASEIFYGENEFRFTNEFGWWFFLAFLLAIGQDNVARLRHLTVWAPWKGSIYGRFGYDTDNAYKGKMLEKMLLRKGVVERLTFRECVNQSMALLEQAGKLETLQFVLFQRLRLYESPALPLGINLSKFESENFSITLVYLRETEEDLGGEAGGDAKQLQFPLRLELPGQGGNDFWDPRKIAAMLGWESRHAIANRIGRYTVTRWEEDVSPEWHEDPPED